MYRSPDYQTSFESIDLPVPEKNFNMDFLRWRSSWISNQNNFSYFWSTSQLDTSNEASSQLAFWFRIKKFKIDC